MAAIHEAKWAKTRARCPSPLSLSTLAAVLGFLLKVEICCLCDRGRCREDIKILESN